MHKKLNLIFINKKQLLIQKWAKLSLKYSWTLGGQAIFFYVGRFLQGLNSVKRPELWATLNLLLSQECVMVYCIEFSDFFAKILFRKPSGS